MGRSKTKVHFDDWPNPNRPNHRAACGSWIVIDGAEYRPSTTDPALITCGRCVKIMQLREERTRDRLRG